MTREQALDAYRRVREWNDRQTARIAAQIRATFGDYTRMHNATVSAELGRPWTELPRDYPRLARRYRWQQDYVWDTSRRLEKAFARYF